MQYLVVQCDVPSNVVFWLLLSEPKTNRHGGIIFKSISTQVGLTDSFAQLTAKSTSIFANQCICIDGCFPPGGIFCAEQNCPLFKNQLVESGL